ncbi:hypothetical protein ABZ820_19560 [Streptomyces diacarni]
MADLNPEEGGRGRWADRLKQLAGCLSFALAVYKIAREISSHL